MSELYQIIRFQNFMAFYGNLDLHMDLDQNKILVQVSDTIALKNATKFIHFIIKLKEEFTKNPIFTIFVSKKINNFINKCAHLSFDRLHNFRSSSLIFGPTGSNNHSFES